MTTAPSTEQVQRENRAALRFGFLTQHKEAGASDAECERLMTLYDDQHAKRAAALSDIHKIVLESA